MQIKINKTKNVHNNDVIFLEINLFNSFYKLTNY